VALHPYWSKGVLLDIPRAPIAFMVQGILQALRCLTTQELFEMLPISKTEPATNLAKLLERGDISSVELVQHYLDRIDAHADNSVFIRITDQRALEEAKASDERRAVGKTFSKWDGIPVAWKDLFDTKGDTTTAGSKIYENGDVADKDADVVRTCEQMGLVCIGKTNLSEFAYSGLGLNPHFGTPVNPASTTISLAPGGSSAGSAVAVAAGLAPISVGTDTAGSVRVPASFCGVFGFKSSQNRYSKEGVFPLSKSLDSLGTFAHSVDDLVFLDGVMRGVEPDNLRPMNTGDLKFVVPNNVVQEGIEPAVLDQFEVFLQQLATAGADVTRQCFPVFDEVSQLFGRHGTLTVAEAATLHQELLSSEKAELMDQRVRTRMSTASDFSAQDYIMLQWERERLQEAVGMALGNAFLLFPTVAMTAPSIIEVEASDELFAKTNLLALRNTMLGNYLGTPGVSLPIGTNNARAPIGALVSAPFGQDDRVLAAARVVEKSLRL